MNVFTTPAAWGLARDSETGRFFSDSFNLGPAGDEPAGDDPVRGRRGRTTWTWTRGRRRRRHRLAAFPVPAREEEGTNVALCMHDAAGDDLASDDPDADVDNMDADGADMDGVAADVDGIGLPRS